MLRIANFTKPSLGELLTGLAGVFGTDSRVFGSVMVLQHWREVSRNLKKLNVMAFSITNLNQSYDEKISWGINELIQLKFNQILRRFVPSL